MLVPGLRLRVWGLGWDLELWGLGLRTFSWDIRVWSGIKLKFGNLDQLILIPYIPAH